MSLETSRGSAAADPCAAPPDARRHAASSRARIDPPIEPSARRRDCRLAGFDKLELQAKLLVRPATMPRRRDQPEVP
jgi:hypothetical protein